MSGKHQKTLKAIFDNPARAGIAWSDIESMLAALGAEISEGAGSRVRIALNGVRAVFHRPHPRRNADKGAVVSMRRFWMLPGSGPVTERGRERGTNDLQGLRGHRFFR